MNYTFIVEHKKIKGFLTFTFFASWRED